MADTWDPSLDLYNMSEAAVRPILWSLRFVNSAADAIFYDIGVLGQGLFSRGYLVTAAAANADAARQQRRLEAAQAVASHVINLGALTDPEGAILVIDASQAPYVTRYADVRDFLAKETGVADDPRPVHTVSITGVGSSALGSAALAWNLSVALDEPVAAIVPGYGLADIVPQALGGWFGFGLDNYLRNLTQQFVDVMAPHLAKAGRHLSMTAPHATNTGPDGTPVFRSGNPASDILHDILTETAQITRVCGHSKGALCIQNAICNLDEARTKDLEVLTLGCPINEQTPARYDQVLGWLDGLGQLNAWGNLPEHWIWTWHSTNSMLPLTMQVGSLATAEAAALAAVAGTAVAGAAAAGAAVAGAAA